MKYFGGPKISQWDGVIQKGYKEDSQKQLRKLGMASTNREREKIQSSQNSVKMISSQRARHKISNGANNLSNRVIDRKTFTVKFWST